MGNPYARARAGVRATRKILSESRTQGFKQTNSVIDAIYGNLSTTERGLGRQLGAAQARQLSAIQRLQQNATAKNTKLSRGARLDVSKMYGTAIGAGTDFSGVKAQRKAGAISGAGAERAGARLAQGNSAAVDIAQAGAAEAKAGAQYETSQALAYRAKNDAQLVASQALELQKMRLQNQLDLQNYKEKARFSKKLEEDTGDQSIQGMTQTGSQLAQASAKMRQYLVDHPEATAQDLVTNTQADFPIAASDPNFAAAMAMIATNVRGSVNSEGQTVDGYTQQDEANDVYGVITRFYQPPKKVGTAVLDSINTGLPTFYTALSTAPAPTDQAYGGQVIDDAVNRVLSPLDELFGGNPAQGALKLASPYAYQGP